MRIEIRAQDVTQLDELAAYTPAWLPAPFLPRPVAEAALDRLTVALGPKGNLVVGLYAVPTDKAGAALTALRVARSGGHLWDIAEMEQQLRARGFVDVETCHIPPTTFVGHAALTGTVTKMRHRSIGHGTLGLTILLIGRPRTSIGAVHKPREMSLDRSDPSRTRSLQRRHPGRPAVLMPWLPALARRALWNPRRGVCYCVVLKGLGLAQ